MPPKRRRWRPQTLPEIRLRADFREGDEDSNFSVDEDSNFSVLRVRRFTEWPEPLH